MHARAVSSLTSYRVRQDQEDAARRLRYPDGFQSASVLVSLWVGKDVAAYLNRELRNVTIRHRSKPVSDAEARKLDLVVNETCLDLGYSNVLVDLRLAPLNCKCSLCSAVPQYRGAALACAIDPKRRRLSVRRRFDSLFGAEKYLEQIQIHAASMTGTMTLESVLSGIREYNGEVFFGNYAGAIYTLASANALYVHLSGDYSEPNAIQEFRRAATRANDIFNESHVLLDLRHRGDASDLMLNILFGTRGLCLHDRHVIRIGTILPLSPPACRTLMDKKSLSDALEALNALNKPPALVSPLRLV